MSLAICALSAGECVALDALTPEPGFVSASAKPRRHSCGRSRRARVCVGTPRAEWRAVFSSSSARRALRCAASLSASLLTQNAYARDNAEPTHYLGVQADLDLSLVSGRRVCAPDSRDQFYCVDEASRAYTGQPQPDRDDDNIPTRFSISNLRLLLRYEYFLSGHWAGAALAGYAFGGGPTPPGGSAFLPLHAELRLGYYPAGLHADRLTPLIFVSGGVMQVDTGVQVKVTEVPCSNGEEACQRELTAYRRTGLGFVGLGGGASYRFARSHNVSATLRTSLTFSATSFQLTPELSYTLGF